MTFKYDFDIALLSSAYIRCILLRVQLKYIFLVLLKYIIFLNLNLKFNIKQYFQSTAEYLNSVFFIQIYCIPF